MTAIIPKQYRGISSLKTKQKKNNNMHSSSKYLTKFHYHYITKCPIQIRNFFTGQYPEVPISFSSQNTVYSNW